MDFVTFLILQTPSPTIAGESSAGSAMWQSIIKLSREISAALPYIALAVVVFAVFFFGARFAARTVKALVLRMRFDPHLAALLGSLTTFTVTLAGIVFGVLVLFPGFNPLEILAALGAISVAIGFVFKDIADNFLSGIMILWRKPFVIGDEIKVGEYEGTVQGFTFRSTLIKTYQSELVFVPHSHIYANELVVKTAYETRIVQFQVGIGYLDDIEKGRETIQRATLETEGVIADPAPAVYVTGFGDSSLNFTVFFLAESKQMNIVRVFDRVATNIRYALDKAGIDMPYPHAVVLLQDQTEAAGNIRQAKQHDARGENDQ